MIIECLYDINGAGNQFFKQIFSKIHEGLNKKYTEVEFKHVQPNQKETCWSCPGGYANLQIINPKNNKTILLSFWDRGMDTFLKCLGWEKYNLIDYYGGIGMFESSENIKEKYGVNHYPLQYPLGAKNSDIFIEKHRIKYNFEDRK